MPIAITAVAPDLGAQVDPRFGRAPFFLLVTDDGSFEPLENPNAAAGGGAGIQAAQLLAERDVTHVLTGNCGPNAHRTLSAAGIQVVVGCEGVARDVLGRFRNGELGASAGPNVGSHFGGR